MDEAATEHSEAVSEEPVEDIPESIGQQDTGKEESSEKPVRKPEKKKIGDTMRLDEALEQLLHRKPEVSAAEDEEPDISDLESAIGDIESVVDLDMVNQISQEKHTGDVPIGMKELIPGEVSEEAADKTERIPVEITTDITEDDAEELDLEDLVAEELPEEVEEAEPVEEEAEEVEEAEPVEEEAEKVEEAEPVEEEAEEVEEAEPVEEEAEEVEEAEPIEETQTGTIEEELQKIADAEPAEPEEEIFDMEEAEDFLEDSPAEDWEDDTESFEEADAEELSFEEILSDWDSEEAEALLEDAEEEVYDESVEETYEEEPDEEPNEEPDEDVAEDILEGAEAEPIEESAEDVVEADAEEIYEEEPEDEVTEDTPILSPDIQRMIDEIEGVVPAEESLPEEKEIEKAPEEPHENMGEVTESLRLDDLPEEDEDLFEDEDFLESEDEEDEYESYEDDDSEEDEYESYEDGDSEEDEYESYEDDDSEEDEYESYEDDDSEDEYASYDEDEYEDEIYDDEYEDDDEAYYEESDDDELADDEEFYYEDEEEPDEEDAPDFEDEFKVDPKHSEEPDDREIPDEDDGIDIMSATTPLSRKETAKLIATGKTSPLPLDEISDALSMDTGFVVHGRYDLETQSGIGTRAGLTEEQKKLFSYFVPVRGMSEQLVDVLEQDKNCTNRKGTSKTGNLLIIGDKGNGKTVLAVDVVKAIQKQREIRQGKVAIVTGESLNKKKIGDIFDKLYGGALIIEKAGKMNEKTVAKLNRAMERDTGELLIVLEEQRKPLDRLLSSNREFRRKFTSRLEVPIFINDELVTFGQTYAQENGYKIDEMGILALYSCIDSLQREDHSVTVAEVKEVMDKAIAHSQKASAKKLVKRVFGRNTDSSDRIILSERDFNI